MRDRTPSHGNARLDKTEWLDTHPTPNLAAPIMRNATLVTSMSGFTPLFGRVQLCRIAVLRRTTRMALRIIGAATPTVRKT